VPARRYPPPLRAQPQHYQSEGLFNQKNQDGLIRKTTTLTVTKAGTGSGTVNATGCTLNWTGNTGTCTADNGTSITLPGVADTGSTFGGWSGGTGSASSCTGTGDCTFTITQDSGVTATFNDDQAAVVPVNAPTMSEWGMIVFMIFTGLVSVYYLRRRRLG